MKRSSRYVATKNVWYCGTARQTPLTWAVSALDESAFPYFFSISATTSETSTSCGSYSHGKCIRISTRSWPAWLWTSEAYLDACWAWAMWSILSLMPVSLVKRWPISASFLSEAGAKLFQQR